MIIESTDLPALNRSILTIEAKQPFVDWLNSIREEEELEGQIVYTVDDVNDELTAYLIPAIFDSTELEDYLDHAWIMLFDLQLSGWMLEEMLWPQKRTRKMFDQWFSCKCSSLVLDMWGKEPLDYQD
jgi:hypothetical protein